MSRAGDRTWNVVSGALRSAINDHGPVTEKQIGSATKRIVAQLRSAAEDVSLLVPEGEGVPRGAIENVYKRLEKLKHGHGRLQRNCERLKDENARLRAVVDAIAPLMDPEVCSPFISAWELDSYRSDVDGEAIWKATKAAHDEAVALPAKVPG